MALIDLQNISKHYSAQKILTEVNFHVDEGERIVIIGKKWKWKIYSNENCKWHTRA